MIRAFSPGLLGVLLWGLALAPCRAETLDFEFHVPRSAGDANVPAAMRDLAERILPVYEEPDRERYLANLSALQLVAGNYAAAHATQQALRERQGSTEAGQQAGEGVLVDLYAQAKTAEAGGGISFAQAFRQSFRDVVPRLSDRDAYAATASLGIPRSRFEQAVQESFDQVREKTSITLSEAIDLIRTYLDLDVDRSVGPLLDTLAGEDDRRRYVIDDTVSVKSAGADLHARIVRPKGGPGRLPALLEFTILASPHSARACAAHGYAGVVAYTRGKNHPGKKGSRGSMVPFEHDGEDARAVIDWIARQPWSDGRVGMYGDGYGGFAAWAAAKRAPRALKAIATADAMAPGIDFPMEGQVFRNAAYRWASVHASAADDASDEDDAHHDAYWRALDQTWYRSGKRYRELDVLAKKPSSIFQRWLSHPSYDRYWQKMIPFREQFAAIDIPVLATTGYYAGGEVGALYYFTQHHRYKPDADHTLVIGPYGDGAMQGAPAAVLRGYAVDATARIDLAELRYQWFDHIFKGDAKPALLQDRVNYAVMGANEWRHAPSLEAMTNGALRFYLDVSDAHRLVPTRPAKATPPLQQIVKFADRSDAVWPPSSKIIGRILAVRHGLTFVSEPLQQPMELSGLLSGQLDFKTSKADIDLNVTLYELLPGGDYLQLSDPYEFRASYARDRRQRRPLRAGARQQLPFRSEQMTGRRVDAGSRVVLVLGVNKRPDREINYGTGGDVSGESIADAGAPLKIQWYGSSYVDVPVRK